MKPEKAIEIKETELDGTVEHSDEELRTADALSIQALLYVERNRLGDVINPDALLPGETEE